MKRDVRIDEPITRRIPPKRQAAARHYGSHPYFTRRAWNVVQEYIRHFSGPGEVVLDPFGGSGVTAVEALVLGRKAVHVDLNPLANFITEQIARAPVSLAKLAEGFEEVGKGCAPELAQWRGRPNSFFESKDPPYWFPRDVRLPRNADARFVDELFTRRQLFVLSLILDRIQGVRDETTRDLLRFCFSGTLAKTNRTFVSARGRAETRGGAGIFSLYRYNIPNQPVELDPWQQFVERFENLMRCKKETNRLIGGFYGEDNCRIIRGSATALPDFLPAESIDYIFTDPPYGAHIAYLDLSTMWNAWLGFDVGESEKAVEVIEGGDVRHTREDYVRLLRQSIEAMERLLRPGRWLSIVFQHKDLDLYAEILDAAEENGLSHVNTTYQSLHVVWSMHKKKNRMKVLSGELILNFVKAPRRAGKRRAEPDEGMGELVREAIEQELASNGGARTEDIFNHVMVRLIDTGRVRANRMGWEEFLGLLSESGFEYDSRAGVWRRKGQPVPHRKQQSTLFEV